MPSPRRDRDRRRARRPPFRNPKPTILIVCEGEKTEKQYFDGFWHACRNPRVQVQVADEHGLDPKTLVETAKQHKKAAEEDARRETDDNLAYDSVWCVFDIDEHQHVPDARQMARDNGIELAISNPRFELWLLLHFRESPGMQPGHRVTKMLEKYVPNYDKGIDFERYQAAYTQAALRAQRMDRAADEEGDSGRNPTTGVYRLTELIREDTILG